MTKEIYDDFEFYDEMMYEVIVPESKYSYKMKDIRFENELAFKGSLIMSNDLMIDHINRLIFNCIVSSSNKKIKPNTESGYKEFLGSTTLLDREVLLHAIYVNNYGSDYEIKNFMCSNNYNEKTKKPCDHVFPKVKFDLIKCADEKEFKGKPGEICNLKKDIKINDKITFRIKFPTLITELESIKREFDTDDINLASKVDCVILTKPAEEGKEPISKEFKDPENIIKYFKKLRPKDRKKVNDEFKNLVDTDFTISYKHKCPVCGHENTHYVVILMEFFRMAREL